MFYKLAFHTWVRQLQVETDCPFNLPLSYLITCLASINFLLLEWPLFNVWNLKKKKVTLVPQACLCIREAIPWKEEASLEENQVGKNISHKESSVNHVLTCFYTLKGHCGQGRNAHFYGCLWLDFSESPAEFALTHCRRGKYKNKCSYEKNNDVI